MMGAYLGAFLIYVALLLNSCTMSEEGKRIAAAVDRNTAICNGLMSGKH
jgi:hypothetical protein